MVKFTSTMQQPFILLYNVQTNWENKFLGQNVFLPGRFDGFQMGTWKNEVFYIWVIIGVVCFNRIYYIIYTSFEHLENYLEHGKDRFGLSLMCYLLFKIEKNNIGKTGGPLFLQTSDIYIYFLRFFGMATVIH